MSLPGGHLHQVVRIDDTVRRPSGPWSPTVHSLLAHIRSRGFPLAPEPLGFDEQGREVLSYIAGESIGAAVPWPSWTRDEGFLAEIGSATAALHRAVVDFRPAGTVPWFWGPAELGPDQIVCHHDLAPYNVVVAGSRISGIIDWDLIAPGTARSELAFAAWQWVPLHDPMVARYFGWTEAPDHARRLRILLDAYGLEERDGFVHDVVERILLNREVMVRKAAEGHPAYIRLEREGHVMGMDRAVEFLLEQGPALQSRIG